MLINAPISIGELIDKLTIINIKRFKLTDPKKLANVEIELIALSKLTEQIYAEARQTDKLRALTNLIVLLSDINKKIWIIEDDIRACEARQAWDQEFIELARGVYLYNDERAKIKRQINELMGSQIVEEKSYTEYK